MEIKLLLAISQAKTKGDFYDRHKTETSIHSPELEKLSYPPDCPFSTQRAGKTRDLLVSLGLLGGSGIKEIAPKPATRSELEVFHSTKYLDELQLAAESKLTKEGSDMGLGTPDCPVFNDMYKYASLACGATLTGAELILSGETNIAFNPAGGFHHAKAEKASGFCYINDVVLGCLRLTEKGKRVLCLDIDAHHCDGVQDAFYSRKDVMVVLLHESGKTLFPWTGFEDEIGEGPGVGFNVNVPLPVGIFDETYMTVFNKIVLPLINAYEPDVIVLELGMDALAWKTLSGTSDESDLSFGLGGVMLQSEEWAGGLRDRVLPVPEKQRMSINSAIETTITIVKKNIFEYHGLDV